MRKIIITISLSVLFVYATVIGLISLQIDHYDLWYSNVFQDKVYVLILTPMFMMIESLIESNMSQYMLSRIGRRDAAALYQSSILDMIAIAYVLVWVLMVWLFSEIKFGFIVGTWMDWLGLIGRYIYGLIVLVNLVMCICSLFPNLQASIRCIIAYCILVIEVLFLVPEVKINYVNGCSILFSWVFDESDGAFVFRWIIILISYLIMFCLSKRRDIYQ